MNLIIDCDSNFVYPTKTMLYSLRKNTDKNEKINVYLNYFENKKLNEKELNELKKVLYKTDNLFYVKIEQPFNYKIEDIRWTDQVLLKLLGLYYLPEDVERIVHIDGDIVVDKDIKEFYYDENLKGNVLLGVNENPSKERLDSLCITDGIYLCAGCLLINVKEFKKIYPTQADLEKAFNSLPFPKPRCGEQDIINYLFSGKKAQAKDGNKYMFFTAWESLAPEGTAIYHYAGKYKPWKYDYDNNYLKEFWKYAKHAYPLNKRISFKFNRFKWEISRRLFKK